jgi:hypothetical protein
MCGRECRPEESECVGCQPAAATAPSGEAAEPKVPQQLFQWDEMAKAIATTIDGTRTQEISLVGIPESFALPTTALNPMAPTAALEFAPQPIELGDPKEDLKLQPQVWKLPSEAETVAMTEPFELPIEFAQPSAVVVAEIGTTDAIQAQVDLVEVQGTAVEAVLELAPETSSDATVNDVAVNTKAISEEQVAMEASISEAPISDVPVEKQPKVNESASATFVGDSDDLATSSSENSDLIATAEVFQVIAAEEVISQTSVEQPVEEFVAVPEPELSIHMTSIHMTMADLPASVADSAEFSETLEPFSPDLSVFPNDFPNEPFQPAANVSTKDDISEFDAETSPEIDTIHGTQAVGEQALSQQPDSVQSADLTSLASAVGDSQRIAEVTIPNVFAEALEEAKTKENSAELVGVAAVVEFVDAVAEETTMRPADPVHVAAEMVVAEMQTMELPAFQVPNAENAAVSNFASASASVLESPVFQVPAALTVTESVSASAPTPTAASAPSATTHPASGANKLDEWSIPEQEAVILGGSHGADTSSNSKEDREWHEALASGWSSEGERTVELPKLEIGDEVEAAPSSGGSWINQIIPSVNAADLEAPKVATTVAFNVETPSETNTKTETSTKTEVSNHLASDSATASANTVEHWASSLDLADPLRNTMRVPNPESFMSATESDADWRSLSTFDQRSNQPDTISPLPSALTESVSGFEQFQHLPVASSPSSLGAAYTDPLLEQDSWGHKAFPAEGDGLSTGNDLGSSGILMREVAEAVELPPDHWSLQSKGNETDEKSDNSAAYTKTAGFASSELPKDIRDAAKTTEMPVRGESALREAVAEPSTGLSTGVGADPSLKTALASNKTSEMPLVGAASAGVKKANNLPVGLAVAASVVLAGLIWFGVTQFGGATKAQAAVVPSAAIPVRSHPLARHLEIVGFRIQPQQGLVATVRFVVVNHSKEPISGLNLGVAVKSDTGRGEPELAVSKFSARLDEALEAEGSAEVEAQVRLNTAVNVSVWQALRPEFTIESVD